jgi:hypothetical protein
MEIMRRTVGESVDGGRSHEYSDSRADEQAAAEAETLDGDMHRSRL